MTADEVAEDIVDTALKIHRALGPGRLESAYQACLAHDLSRRVFFFLVFLAFRSSEGRRGSLQEVCAWGGLMQVR